MVGGGEVSDRNGGSQIAARQAGSFIFTIIVECFYRGRMETRKYLP